MRSIIILAVIATVFYSLAFGGAFAAIAWLFGKSVMTGFLLGVCIPIVYYVFVAIVHAAALLYLSGWFRGRK